jgi:predicted thioesterase
VTPTDCASAVGSGDVDVLATPRVVALVEAATVDALRGQLAAGQTSVGTRVSLDHRRPSWPGATVVATAHLRSVEGNRLQFDVEAREGDDVVAAGTVERATVGRDRFRGGGA